MCLLNLELGEPAAAARIPSLSEAVCNESASSALSVPRVHVCVIIFVVVVVVIRIIIK